MTDERRRGRERLATLDPSSRQAALAERLRVDPPCSRCVPGTGRALVSAHYFEDAVTDACGLVTVTPREAALGEAVVGGAIKKALIEWALA